MFGRVVVASPAQRPGHGQPEPSGNGPPIFIWRSGPTQPGRPQVLFGERLGAELTAQNRPKLLTLRRAEPGSLATVIFRVRVEPGRGGSFGPQQAEPREAKVEPNV